MSKVLDFCRKNLAWVLLFICCVIFSAFSENFFTVRNILNILNQNAYIIIAAFGICFLMMSGGMDLSIGYMMSLTGVISARLMVDLGMPVWLVVIVTILLCMAFSTLNTVLSHLLGIPRMFVTFDGISGIVLYCIRI